MMPAAAVPLVNLRLERGVAILTLDHPPVNALSSALRLALYEHVRELSADRSILALILTGAGRGFCAGADIRDLSGAAQPPTLPDLVALLAHSRTPVIAALHGAVLGGGLELALGAHHRIADAGAMFGLPEIKLGLIPGAGGTQRLPRLIGMPAALGLILSGESIGAARALELGLIDELAGDVLAAALAAARRLAAAGPADAGRLRRLDELPVSGDDETPLNDAAAGLAARKPLLPAPLKAIEALRAAAELPFEEGMKVERSAFLALRDSPESAALRHAFAAEREAARLPATLAAVPTRRIGTAAVVGAGTMGQGIALVLAEAGIPVQLVDAEQAALQRALASIAGINRSRVSRGKLSAEQEAALSARIRPTVNLEDLKDTDFVIEAVFEDVAVKSAVLGRLDGILKPGALLASNTSYLDIDDLAAATRRPQDVIGMHFFSPAQVMRLLEVVPGARTDPSAQATALALAKRLGKQAVLVGNARGFVGNRMLARRTREAYFLLEEGATPWQVDAAFTDFGFPMGPFAVGDLSGLDIGWRNRRAVFDRLTPREQRCTLLDQLIDAGRLGQKAGRGFYRYDAERRAQPDPEVESLIERHARAVGRERRAFGSEEILERCLIAMIDEGARILGERRARSAADIDVVWLHGYGFPRHRGGPMYHADQLGLAAVRDAILRYQAEHGAQYWAVAPVLESLGAAGGTFGSWSPALPEAA